MSSMINDKSVFTKYANSFGKNTVSKRGIINPLIMTKCVPELKELWNGQTQSLLGLSLNWLFLALPVLIHSRYK